MCSSDLHALTWRVRGHVSVDTQGYRDPLDLQGAIDADPLRRARASALAAGVSAAALDAIDAEVQAEIEDAVAFAKGKTCYSGPAQPHVVLVPKRIAIRWGLV